MSQKNKKSFLQTIFIVILIFFIGYLLYSNNQYEEKLEQFTERETRYINDIKRLQFKDSISSRYFTITEGDSALSYTVRYKNGQSLNYSQLDSLINDLEEQIMIKDRIIENTQSIFNYQYNVERNKNLFDITITYTSSNYNTFNE